MFLIPIEPLIEAFERNYFTVYVFEFENEGCHSRLRTTL